MSIKGVIIYSPLKDSQSRFSSQSVGWDCSKININFEEKKHRKKPSENDVGWKVPYNSIFSLLHFQQLRKYCSLKCTDPLLITGNERSGASSIMLIWFQKEVFKLSGSLAGHFDRNTPWFSMAFKIFTDSYLHLALRDNKFVKLAKPG